jgi:hypothetical protein
MAIYNSGSIELKSAGNFLCSTLAEWDSLTVSTRKSNF